MGMNRIELAFRQRPVAQSELDRNIVKPARREAAIEMPQSRNDHARRPGRRCRGASDRARGSRGPRAREVHAGGHLLARVEMAELRAEVRSDRRTAARRQIGMVLQAKWRGAVEARFLSRRRRP